MGVASHRGVTLFHLELVDILSPSQKWIGTTKNFLIFFLYMYNIVNENLVKFILVNQILAKRTKTNVTMRVISCLLEEKRN